MCRLRAPGANIHHLRSQWADVSLAGHGLWRMLKERHDGKEYILIFATVTKVYLVNTTVRPIAFAVPVWL